MVCLEWHRLIVIGNEIVHCTQVRVTFGVVHVHATEGKTMVLGVVDHDEMINRCPVHYVMGDREIVREEIDCLNGVVPTPVEVANGGGFVRFDGPVDAGPVFDGGWLIHWSLPLLELRNGSGGHNHQAFRLPGNTRHIRMMGTN